MNFDLLDMLECPICHCQLDWNIKSSSKEHIEQAEVNCTGCSAVYHVKDGIGIFLTPDLPRNDLWDQVDSQLALYLREHPQLEKQLMEGPVEELSPTDQHYRALILDERGDFAAAKKIEDQANENLYTTELSACWKSQVEYTVDSLASFEGPIVDLASGRCYLVGEIVDRLHRPVIATDFSLTVLRRDRKYFQFLGLDDLVSFLAFDARKTPFKKDAVGIMTTNVGLPNIEEPGDLLNELQRIIKGTFLAISHFYPIEDQLNREVISEAGIEAFVYQESALHYFEQAGWKAQIENPCLASALPTPESKILAGARADGLPVASTHQKWCTIRAESRTDG